MYFCNKIKYNSKYLHFIEYERIFTNISSTSSQFIVSQKSLPAIPAVLPKELTHYKNYSEELRHLVIVIVTVSRRYDKLIRKRNFFVGVTRSLSSSAIALDAHQVLWLLNLVSCNSSFKVVHDSGKFMKIS